MIAIVSRLTHRRAQIATGVACCALIAGAGSALAAPPPDLPPASATTQSAIGHVLMVGDSLSVGTGPYLEKELHGPNVRVNGEVSRSSGAGLEILRAELKRGDDVVVFDLGTNDDPSIPESLLADFEQARQLIGDRCMIVATLNRPDYNGVSINGMNAMINRFAAADPTVQVVGWHEAIKGNPELVEGDGVHTTPAGYAARAKLMTEAIAACPSSLADESSASASFDFPETEDADQSGSITFSDRPEAPDLAAAIVALLVRFAGTVAG